jgi:glycine cleavage system transcriptional repressor
VHTLALLALGVDRPGIVAAVTERLAGHGVNIEDSQMSILGGHFAMVLILSAPDDVEPSALRGELEDVAQRLGLEGITLSTVSAAAAAAAEPTHLVTLYGADHPGIVHRVTSALAAADVNVTNLTTRLADDVYVMVLEVAAPGDVDPADVLREPAREESVEVTVRSLESDTL